ncbi:MAG: alanine racemase, partial [Anaerolineae bacterium]|nr:alanine racemase [Anaerolineae bacterium]
MHHPPDPQEAVGRPVAELDTPALLVDVDALERNLATMAGFFAGRPAHLRPHVKTHKCPEIARLQLAGGAQGITCAKLGEAEAFVAAGIDDILIAGQIVGPLKIARLVDLARRARITVAVDDAANVAALSEAAERQGLRLPILLEVDVGMGRCGVAPGAPALALAREVAAAGGLELAGLMGYEGHLVLVRDPAERKARVEAALAPLLETRAL